MDENNQAAIQRGNACILQGLWEHVSFGVKKFCKPEEVARLLALASKTKSSDLLEATAVDEVRHAIDLCSWNFANVSCVIS